MSYILRVIARPRRHR